MTTNQRNRISLATAILGAMSAVSLEAAHTPGEGLTRASVVFGIFALAAMRLYLFYEGTALAEIDKDKAKIAFKLSIILSIALAGYGVAIWLVNPDFQNYALALFLMLQMGLAFTEWVFSTRTGEQVNTVLVGLQRQRKRTAELALHFRSLYQDTTKRIDLLSKENAKHSGDILKLKEQVVRLTETDQSNTKTLKKLFGTAAKIERINGRPVSFCPSCITRGSINLLVGGPRSAKLDCIECGYEVVVPKKELKLT